MLPSFLVNTYKRYKQDTDAFTIWLENTARSCGYSGNAGPKPGGENPSSGKRPYRIALSSFVRLANVIAKHDPKVPVPSFIATMGLRIVALRQKCSRWYASQTGGAASAKSMVEHAHFIQVFQTVLKTLGVEESTAEPDNPADAPPTSQKKKKLNVRRKVDEALNRFNTLELQQPNPDVLNHIMSAETALVSSKATDTEALTDVRVVDDYDIWSGDFDEDQFDSDVSEVDPSEWSDEDEQAILDQFRMYCLLEDVKSIRHFIKQLWLDFKSGKVDLMTAAVVTNTAIAFVRQQCEDESLASLELDHVGGALERFYFLVCALKGVQGHNRGNTQEPLKEDTLYIAKWCCLDTCILLQSCMDVLRQNDGIAKVKRGRLGIFDPRADRSAMSPSEKFREDKILLTESFQDFSFLAQIQMPLPADDEYTAGIRHMIATDKTPFWLCFAARTFLDVMHSLRTEHSVPYKQLRHASERIQKTLTNYFDFAEYMSTPNWPAQNDQVLKKILEDVDRYVLGKDPYSVLDLLDSISSNRSARVQKRLDDIAAKKNGGSNKSLDSGGNTSDYRFLKQHGLLAGTLLFNFNLRIHEAGTLLSSAWGSIIYPAFLYNEIQNQDHATLSWPDMDQVITFHGEQGMFAGPRPKDLETTFKRTQIMLGYSMDQSDWENFDGKSAKTAPASKEGPKGLTNPTVISALLKQRYVYGGSMAVSQQNVGRLLNDLAGKDELVRSDASSALHKKWTTSQKLSTLELLALLRERLMDEERKLTFNYFGLHQRCIELMRLIKDANDAKFKQYFGRRYLEQEYQLSWICNWLFLLGVGGQQVAKKLKLDQAGMQRTGSTMMIKTGKLMAEWLEKNGRVAVKELRTLVINKHLLDPVSAAQNKASGMLDSGYLVPLREILGFDQDEMDAMVEMTRRQLTIEASEN